MMVRAAHSDGHLWFLCFGFFSVCLFFVCALAVASLYLPVELRVTLRNNVMLLSPTSLCLLASCEGGPIVLFLLIQMPLGRIGHNSSNNYASTGANFFVS